MERISVQVTTDMRNLISQVAQKISVQTHVKTSDQDVIRQGVLALAKKWKVLV